MRRAAVLVALSLVAGLAGCGGDDPRSIATAQRTAPFTAEQAAVEEAYRAFITAFFGDDPAAACGRLTDRARREVVGDAGSRADQACRQRAREASESARSFYPGLRFVVEAVDVRGDRATLTATFESTEGPERTVVTLLREGGRWLVDENGDG